MKDCQEPVADSCLIKEPDPGGSTHQSLPNFLAADSKVSSEIQISDQAHGLSGLV
jgi:hypothetical protein